MINQAHSPFELSIRLAFLGLLVIASFIIVRPFVGIIAGSVILAVAIYPVFSVVAMWLGERRRLAAAVITLFGLLIVIGPTTWLGLSLVKASETLYRGVNSGEISIPHPVETVKSWPLIGGQLFHFWNLASTNFQEALAEVAPQLKPLGSVLLGAAATVGKGLLYMLLCVVIAGFLLPPGPALVEAITFFLRRLISKRSEQFVQLAGATIRSVSQGVIGISLLQALLAGIGLIVAGVPAAGLIALCAFILAVVQIGPAIILIPVIIWSWMAMETTQALIFTAYMIPVNLLDNVLKPIVMTRGLTTPMLVIFVGVVGGALSYGIIGLFIGPIVLAVAWDLLIAWLRETETISEI